MLPPWGFLWLQHTDFNINPSLYHPSHFCCCTTNCSLETFLCCYEPIPGVKQPVTPGMKAVQVVGQPSLTAVQKNKLKDGGGETFRFVTHSDNISSFSMEHCSPNGQTHRCLEGCKFYLQSCKLKIPPLQVKVL